ncbi:isomerase [Occultella glacieicola]|uniref:Isomerase n=1 Tax=Occultella glacieicola TaxID=2518684 RepID=A0ABY2E2P8_9MICO|nr:isomerase [Occultella glacieicola]TDE93898.1 isomerase [Occultella glacieicola]
MTTTTTDRIITGYTRFWNTADPAERSRVAATVFTDEIDYHATVGVLTGAHSLGAFRDEFVGHVGGATLRHLDEPDLLPDRARLRWEILLTDGTSFATGTDVLVLAPDGRIASVTAFLDRAPEGFADHHGEQIDA